MNPAKDIVGHQVLDPGRKIDPGNGLKYMGISYSQMLKDVVKEYNECIGKEEAKKPAPVSGSTYTIKKGDTLWGIANDNPKFTVQDLLNWNPGIKAADLKVGQKINISKPKEAPKPAPKPAPKKKYTLPTGVYKRGASGTAVKQIQEGLAAAYFYPDKGAKNNGIDGDYGAKTENAVLRFQMIHMGENAADGQYGPKTRAALDKEIN